ncbi:MAG: DUF928 domain-containing protein [Lyngbya sp.]|nr:DUF928 domain-containing protein [Lyngbya sp.]
MMQSLLRLCLPLSVSCQSISLIGLLILAGLEWASPQLALSRPMETDLSKTRSQERVDKNNSVVVQTFNFQPPDRGAPGTRADAGSRGGCSQSPNQSQKLTALIPTTNWGETIAAHPTFWLYIPTRPAAVEFLLTEEDSEKVVYEGKFPITQGPGIVSFPLPETAPPLEEGKTYRWIFTFSCPSEQMSTSTNSNIPIPPTVSGVIARIAPSAELSQQLENASRGEKILLYAENGLWYETLTELAELRRTQPQNPQVAAQWLNLLQHEAVKLNNIVQEPILSCCQVEQTSSLSVRFQEKGAKSPDQ